MPCGIRPKGQRFWRWPVAVIIANGIFNDPTEVVIEVIAESAPDATHLVRDEAVVRLSKPFEVVAVGPRGGVAHHLYAGWESLIGERMFNSRRPETLQLQLS